MNDDDDDGGGGGGGDHDDDDYASCLYLCGTCRGLHVIKIVTTCPDVPGWSTGAGSQKRPREATCRRLSTVG